MDAFLGGWQLSNIVAARTGLPINVTLNQTGVDPATGKEEFVFSCYNQDQDLDRVDFDNLQARLKQNSVQEKLSTLWFEHLLDRMPDMQLDGSVSRLQSAFISGVKHLPITFPAGPVVGA